MYIQFNQLNRRVVLMTCANPDLQVVTGGLGKCLAEPGRVVELTATAIVTTPSAIPQRVISEKLRRVHIFVVPRITEIVISNK